MAVAHEQQRDVGSGGRRDRRGPAGRLSSLAPPPPQAASKSARATQAFLMLMATPDVWPILRPWNSGSSAARTSRCRCSSFGTGTFGGGAVLQGLGRHRRGRSDAARRHLPRGRAQHVRLGRHLFRRAGGGNSRARRSRAGATRSSSPPRAPFASATGPNDVGSSRNHLTKQSRAACGGWAPTTSTSTNCTASTR